MHYMVATQHRASLSVELFFGGRIKDLSLYFCALGGFTLELSSFFCFPHFLARATVSLFRVLQKSSLDLTVKNKTNYLQLEICPLTYEQDTTIIVVK